MTENRDEMHLNEKKIVSVIFFSSALITPVETPFISPRASGCPASGPKTPIGHWMNLAQATTYS